MDKLYLSPVSAGYAITRPQNDVIRQDVDGGPGIYSAEIEGGTSKVSVSWVRTRAAWQYLEAFFRNRTANGTEPFLIDLVLDGAVTMEYTAFFIPGTLNLTGSNGKMRFVSAQLEVLPAEVDDDANSSVVDIWEASGGEPSEYLNGFAAIIAALPDA